METPPDVAIALSTQCHRTQSLSIRHSKTISFFSISLLKELENAQSSPKRAALELLLINLHSRKIKWCSQPEFCNTFHEPEPNWLGEFFPLAAPSFKASL